jgi:ribonuclease BN (tRNA processing enzyme)
VSTVDEPTLCLTTVGTGTAAPSAARVQAGHLVEAGAVKLLLDCGSGVAFRLAALGLDWVGVTHVALTHFHADHVLDLPTLLVAWRYGTMPPRSAPLELIGPPGTAAFVDRLTTALGVSWATYGFPVTVRELAPGDHHPLGGEATIAARKVPHTDESVAYSVERRGRRLVYSGDTGFDPGLADWAAGCDVLLCECSLPSAMAIPSHLTPEQCAELAERAGPAHLALTHLYPPVEQVDVRGIVAERFAGPVTVARDGWRIDI